MCVCFCVCLSHLGNNTFRRTSDLCSKGVSLILGFRKTGFFPELCNDFFLHKKKVFWSLQTTLLCIVGELAGRGSVAVAVGVGVTCHVSHVLCHMSCVMCPNLQYNKIGLFHSNSFKLNRDHWIFATSDTFCWYIGIYRNLVIWSKAHKICHMQ